MISQDGHQIPCTEVDSVQGTNRVDLHCHSTASAVSKLGVSRALLGWLEGDALPRAYASADLFCFPSRTDTFGQVVLEAQASGLPVVAVAAGGPAELIADGRSGVLCASDAHAIADALCGLARSRRMRERLARGGLAAVTGRTWERSLDRLSEGWSDTPGAASGEACRLTSPSSR